MTNLPGGENSEILDLGNPGQSEPAAPVSEKIVVFQIDDQMFGVRALDVKEVAQPMPLTLLPNSPEWLDGLMNLRGELIAMIKFPFRRGLVKTSNKSKVVVFRPPGFDSAVGFMTDRINEIVSVETSSLEAAEDDNLFGFATVNSSRVGFLNMEKFFESIH